MKYGADEEPTTGALFSNHTHTTWSYTAGGAAPAHELPEAGLDGAVEVGVWVGVAGAVEVAVLTAVEVAVDVAVWVAVDGAVVVDDEVLVLAVDELVGQSQCEPRHFFAT